MLKRLAAVENAWKLYKESRSDGAMFRPLGRRAMVLLDPIPTQSSGGMFFPTSSLDLYSGPAHLRICRAIVMAKGPQCKIVEIGDSVCFVRLYFGRITKLPNGQYIGLVDEAQMLGMAAQDAVICRTDEPTMRIAPRDQQ